MKIAHIVCSYPPYYGGMGNVVLQTVQELGKRGHEVEVLTPLYQTQPGTSPENFEEPVKEQVDYARRITPRVQYGNAAHIPEITKELDRFDLVHLHYPFFGTANLVRKWKLRNPEKPLVITYHMDSRAPGWKGLFFKYYNAFWMPRILGSADLLIGSSFDYLKASDALPLFQTSREKWRELPFGVDVDRFQPREKPMDLFQDAGFDPSLPTLLFVGGMDQAHYFKGVDVLLKALLRLKKNDYSVQAFFVGDGDLRARYEAQAKGYGLQESVKFLGYVEDALLPIVYNAADLFVLPSTTRGEAFGMVLLEALASGVPVVASDLAGVRSVAEDAGMVFPPGDDFALAEVIAGYIFDPQNKEDFSHIARQVALDVYAWPRIIDQLEAWYAELVKNR
ncbi:MAG: Glycosyltransferase (Modular protein) [Candidatus Magasanikbacteria bacterium GW2011_GWD2_43_18]|uniref:Glycosyltransferase (Modular protein) n=1 Tax=Candidatus Magasanikbacteria bacterium GW2011_GWE2_42_7 TaxID=1619052 RepID=A0A0G1BGM0_9BACT|nr:MAG: Glycosyltransferase (Modular protein) [Candidatus Magasanikbacteria bacterium GW2011_GWC2_42_27]KKS72565.1 MAG: Glycosyltransferase (Modular protein) [Candidatus Magasanikbacteria bacterium GW2011_GWE2_42_7]KKT05271.1 MAG: Glycosyltransferase (Modular protein) [Candidatus Magasanikbacteria bacterium GW2011_GWD2_43_18]KKT26107.1 MAG: Glycosyltransferase (Modular protein) [Candidatus Magasanikbacteria bacterium GW2011_GWA2_43_9]HBB37607.1 hypothetical protein [Candidatus Magasanikbacteria